MATHTSRNDRLDEILEELERARSEPSWLPEEPPRPRRLIEAPASLAEGRWAPSRLAAAAVCACVLLAIAIFGLRWMLAREPSGSAPATPAASLSIKAAPGPSAQLTAAAKTNGAAPVAGTGGANVPSVLHIHVVGAVVRPGVVAVKPGARVADAVAAAGGLSRQADAGGINLARPVSDGEQVHVPRPGEKWTPPSDASPAGVPGPSTAAGVAGPGVAGSTLGAGSGGGTSTTGSVNLNTADLSALDSLPGVGPVLAQRILDWRTDHGKFTSVDELGEVSGIGEKMLARLKPKVTV